LLSKELTCNLHRVRTEQAQRGKILRSDRLTRNLPCIGGAL